MINRLVTACQLFLWYFILKMSIKIIKISNDKNIAVLYVLLYVMFGIISISRFIAVSRFLWSLFIW